MIELLAITDDPREPAPPLRAVRCGSLSVLCAPAETGQADADALWRREALLEQLMEERELLPVRYGTRVPDEAAAAAAVAGQAGALAGLLDRVRGAVELAVRARAAESADPSRAPDPADPPRGPSGREYLRARIAGERAAHRIHEPLAALARDSVRQGGPELLRAAYLVDRNAVEPFVAEVRRLQHEHPDIAILCTGPWPPYSFSSAQEAL